MIPAVPVPAPPVAKAAHGYVTVFLAFIGTSATVVAVVVIGMEVAASRVAPAKGTAAVNANPFTLGPLSLVRWLPSQPCCGIMGGHCNGLGVVGINGFTHPVGAAGIPVQGWRWK
jgi:hypothetical protein